MTTSQKQIILNLLESKEWTCTSEMYASYIADPRTRIVELKKKGYLLEWRWCQSHPHNKSKEWRLMSAPPDQLPEAPQMLKTAPSCLINPLKREILHSAPQTPQNPLFA